MPGALNLPHETITPDTLAALDRDRLYVTYGWGPARNAGSRDAAKLAAAGLQVKEMIGGYKYWQRAGHPVETGRDQENPIRLGLSLR